MRTNKPILSGYQTERTIRDSNRYRITAATDSAGRAVRIHELALQSTTPQAVRDRLEYVATALSALELPRYSTPLACEFDGSDVTVVWEVVHGPTLAEQLVLAPLSVDATLDLAEDLLTSLAQLHHHGFLHRCLRPDEIVFAGEPGDLRATITGLGFLSMLLGSSCEELATITATYSAPESLGALEDSAHASSDLYAVGIVLFQCLAGKVPFEGANSGDLLYQHMTTPVPELTAIDQRIPLALSDLIHRLLRKDPRDRYQSAQGVLHDLRAIRSTLHSDQFRCVPLGRMDRRSTLTQPSLVGRSSEICQFQDSLSLVADGASTSCLLSGGSGMGKSRLLAEVQRLAIAQDFRVVRSCGRSQSGLAPLAGLQGVLDECARMIREDDALAFRVRLVANEFGRELRAVVPDLMDELDLPQSGGGELSDRRIAFALATLLGSLGGEQPILIILEDAQWLDELTCLMLESWKLTQPSQTMLVVSTRDDPQDLQSRCEFESIMSVAALTRRATDRLLESMAGPLPGDVLQHLWRLSTGNPFAASALLRGLVETNVMTATEAGWSVDGEKLRDLRMSGEAGEALSERFGRLSAESRQLLAVGAVLGASFDSEMAARLAGFGSEEAAELLRDPRDSYLILDGDNGSACSFAHDQVRRAALETLSAEQCAETHRQAANYLVEHAQDRIFDIAYHFDAGGQPALAKEYALRAAEQARISHALEIAEDQYRIAIRSFEQEGSAAPSSVLGGFGDVLMLAGKYADAERIFEQAADSADSAFRRAEVTLKLGELLFKRDAKDRAIELWESALLSLGRKLPPNWLVPLCALREIFVQAVQSLLPRRFVGRKTEQPTPEDRLAWKLYSRLAHGYWYCSGKASVLYVHLRGMNQAERYQPTPELAQAYSEHAPAMTLVPLSKRGIAYGRRSYEIRTQQGDIWGQGQSLHFLSIALYAAGKFEECIDVGTRAVRILDRAGDYWEKHIAQYQVAASLYRLGRFNEAVAIARQAYDSGLAVGDHQATGNVAEVWARASDGAIPPEILAREAERSRSDMQGVAHVQLGLGVQLVAAGRHAEAVEALDEGIRVARQAGITNSYTSPLLAWKATALRQQLENSNPLTNANRLRSIRKHRRTARNAVLLALRFRNELPHALREYAWAYLLAGGRNIAIILLKRSLGVAEDQGAEYEAIQSNLLLQRVRHELGHAGADEALQDAERRHTAFRSEHFPKSELTSLSLADRFDKLLNSGRQIASAIDENTVMERMLTTARQLLRGDFCEVVRVSDGEKQSVDSPGLDACLNDALQAREAVTTNVVEGAGFRSLLGAPIQVRGQVESCLLVGSSEVRDLFGSNELRIANYITTIAGAALENADGFRKLQDLNSNLEHIVEERTAAVEARSRELQKTADDLRQTQSDLAAARDAAEVANQAKTDFLAQMSHEIRTPIGAVLGFTELLLNDKSPLQPQQREYLERVHSNGDHLHNLLNDLLDLSRIEAGRMTIETLDCEPYRLLFDVLTALQSRAVEKGITLSLRVAGHVPERIRTDPTRLRQIITNLIGNAIKFTNEGSVNVIVDTDVDAEMLRVRIRDTGVGIPESAIENVFEPFRQADESVTRNFGGTGLGLPISRQLARALGGDIDVESEPTVGSTFTVTVETGPLEGIPMLDARDAENAKLSAKRLAATNVDLKGQRILIADDTNANQTLFRQVLAEAGGDCTVVDNGQEALDAAARAEFDLIIMDMQMPVMDGYSATRTLRESGFQPPIVALTANGLEQDERKCRDAGCSGYLTKPISVADLLRGVAEQLELDCETTELEAADTVPAEPSANAAGDAGQADIMIPADPFFRDLSVEFVGEVRLRLPEFHTATEAEDTRTLGRLAHWIKGTGGTVGVDAISKFGREIEAAAQSDDLAAASVLLTELEALCSRFLELAAAENAAL